MWKRQDFDTALVGIARLALDGRWLDVNPALCRMLGQSRSAMVQRRFHDITHPEDLDQELANIKRLLDAGSGAYCMVKRFVRPDGEAFWANLNVSLSLDDNGRPDYFVAVVQDFSATKRQLDQLQHRARHDSLTELPNREHFENSLSEAITFARQSGEKFALVIVDLDGFKQVNDTLGHLHGDDLLRQMAARLRGNIRKSDLAARLGGDEFAVILQDINSQHDLGRATSGIDNCFDRPFVVNGLPITLSASLGTARFPSDGDSMTALIHHADQMMYADKRRRAKSGTPTASAQQPEKTAEDLNPQDAASPVSQPTKLTTTQR